MRPPHALGRFPSKDITERLAVLETQLSRLTGQLRDAEGRAARAEQSCQEAWRFAKTVLRTGRHLAE